MRLLSQMAVTQEFLLLSLNLPANRLQILLRFNFFKNDFPTALARGREAVEEQKDREKTKAIETRLKTLSYRT